MCRVFGVWNPLYVWKWVYGGVCRWFLSCDRIGIVILLRSLRVSLVLSLCMLMLVMMGRGLMRWILGVLWCGVMGALVGFLLMFVRVRRM